MGDAIVRSGRINASKSAKRSPAEGEWESSIVTGDMLRMFRVAVDPPAQGTFFAGSQVTGRLLVETEEEKEFKYIHISLTGRGEVC